MIINPSTPINSISGTIDSLDLSDEEIELVNKKAGVRLKVVRLLLQMSIDDAAEFFNLSNSSYKRLEKNPQNYQLSVIRCFEMLEYDVAKMAKEAGMSFDEALDNAVCQLLEKESKNEVVARGELNIYGDKAKMGGAVKLTVV